jgi:tRNA (cytidine/uridine-2'-O-)-methyltransferase
LVHLALYEPEIPSNAGNIARLCAATGTPLHLIGRLGFSFRHPDAKRAGMDYWDQVEVHRHVNYADFREALPGRRIWMLTTKAERSLWDASFVEGDALLCGPESRGLPADLRESDPACCVRIPMLPAARSLNLASAAAIALYEALRQQGTDLCG